MFLHVDRTVHSTATGFKETSMGRIFSNMGSMLMAKRTVLLGVLAAAAILTCLGTVAYAAEEERDSKILLPERIFDPFRLTTVAATESGSNTPGAGAVLPLATRPPIRTVSVRPLAWRPQIRIPVRLPVCTPSSPGIGE